MAFGFPARFSERRTFQNRQDELAAVVQSAFENLGWSYKVLPGEEFLATVPFGGGTWGAEFKVKIHAGGVIEAESKCITVRMPQVFDFGKNRQNVSAFFAYVERGTGHSIQQSHVHAAEPPGRVEQTVPQRRLAANLVGGCLTALLAFCVLTYLITSIIGLLTGNLYLLGRGGTKTVHGLWARVISALILAVFVWVLVRVLRYKGTRRA